MPGSIYEINDAIDLPYRQSSVGDKTVKMSLVLRVPGHILRHLCLQQSQDVDYFCCCYVPAWHIDLLLLHRQIAEPAATSVFAILDTEVLSPEFLSLVSQWLSLVFVVCLMCGCAELSILSSVCMIYGSVMHMHGKWVIIPWFAY